MKLMRPPKLELYTFLFSMPLIDVALNLILFKERFWTDSKVWLVSFPLIFGIGVLSWYSHVLYSDAIERKYPELAQSRQRIFGKTMIIFWVMTPSVLLIFWVYDHFHLAGYQLQKMDLVKGLFVGLSVNLMCETLY